jgi:hypothetical protein
MTAPNPDGDPLASLLAPPPPGVLPPVRWRSGRVVGWVNETGENAIELDGQTLTDVPVFPGAVQTMVKLGDTVSMLATTDDRGLSTYVIVGLPIRPPDPRLAKSAIAAPIRLIGANISTQGTLITTSGAEAVVPSAKWDHEPSITFKSGHLFRFSLLIGAYANPGPDYLAVVRLRQGSAAIGGAQLAYRPWPVTLISFAGGSIAFTDWFCNTTGAAVTTALTLSVESYAALGQVGLYGDTGQVAKLSVEDYGPMDELTEDAAALGYHSLT